MIARKINQERPDRDAAWPLLDTETRSLVCTLVGACRVTGRDRRQEFRGGEIYAVLNPGGGVAWGVNGLHGYTSRGLNVLQDDYTPPIGARQELFWLARYWGSVDVQKESGDPMLACQLLARIDAQWRAIETWAGRERRVGELDLQVTEGPIKAIGHRRAELRLVIAARSVDAAWRRAFDQAACTPPPPCSLPPGWPPPPP